MFVLNITLTSNRRSMASPMILLGFWMVAVSAVVSTLVGNPIRGVASDLFPFLEPLLFATVARVAFAEDSERQCERWLRFLFAWVALTSFVNLWLYRSLGPRFESKFVNAQGLTLARMDDFVPPLVLPIAVLFAWSASSPRLRRAAFVCSGFALPILLFGFFRSIWLASLFGMVLAMFFSRRRRTAKGSGRRLAVWVALMVVAAIVLPPFFGLRGTAVSVVRDRLFGLQVSKERSVSSRLRANSDLLNTLRAHPLGQGLGSTYEDSLFGTTLPLADAPNFPLALAVRTGLIPAIVLLIAVVTAVYRSCMRALAGGRQLWAAGTVVYAGSLVPVLFLFPAFLHFPLLSLLAIFTVGGNATPLREHG